MAFPSVAGTATSSSTVTTDHVITLPSGVASGDLLIAALTIALPVTVTWPAGWTPLYHVIYGIALVGTAAYRVAVGGETSVTPTTAAEMTASHLSYRITDQHASSAPEVPTAATETSETPDPPSLTVSWGTEQVLWLAMVHHDIGTTVDAYPTNYTNGFSSTAGGSNSTASARREVEAQTEDPSAFDLALLDDWVAQTIGIRPAGAPPAANPKGPLGMPLYRPLIGPMGA